METMKAIAEVHSKSQQLAGPDADTASPVITQQPNEADGLANMEDINLNAEDSLSAEPESKQTEDNLLDAIELKDMLNTSRDDSGISGDVLTTDLALGQSEDDTDLNHDGNSELDESAEIEKQTCDINDSQSNLEQHTAEVHQPKPDTVENSNSEHSQNDAGDEANYKPNDDMIPMEELNQNNKSRPEDPCDEALSYKKPEEVASITSDGSEVTPVTTGNESQPASLDIDVSLDGISTCSFDPEAEIPEVRSSGDGKVDQVSLVDVKVEVKDEMALLSKAIAEVHLEDGKVFEAKVKYQRELREARLKLYRMYKTYRQAIEKTKPYYVAKELEKEMKAELDQTERDAERAKLNFEAAKETEAIAMEAMTNTKAEHGSIGSQGCEGKEAMENWNQATARVLETSKLRAEIEDRLRRKEEQFLQAERSANVLFLELRKFIERAWPYYAMKDQYTRTLEKTRKEIRESGQSLAAAKEKYQETFSRLNLVATEIHQRKTLNDRQSGRGANDNFSQFEEIHDIDKGDSVLSALESRAENLSTCLDGLDDDEEGDIEAELTIMPKSRSMFSMGRSNTRESLDEILDPKKILGEKGRRKTLAQINF